YRLCQPFHDAVAWQARAMGLKQPVQYAHVVATLVYRRRPVRDVDNATASLKPVLDGLVAGGLLVDDGPDHLSLHVRQELGPQRLVRLEIAPAPAVAPDAPDSRPSREKQGETTHERREDP
ncbi:MAG: hypothetical protein ACHQ7M_21850, partial [Chloroflexota bacterium]